MSAFARTTPRFYFRCLRTNVMVESSARWITLLGWLWAPFAGPQRRRALRVAIDPSDTGWSIRFPDRPPRDFEDPWSLLANLGYALEERALAEASEVEAFHAGAVASKGTALLLAGRSGASKTSMTMELLRLGWTYLSDDIAPIRRDNGRVLPFPKPLGFKDPKKWDEYRGLFDGAEWPPPPTGMFCIPPRAVGSVALEEANPRFLIFPTFEPGAKLALEELTPARALAHASRYVRTLSPESVSVLARLCRASHSATLIHGDSRDAARLIDRWVRQVPHEGG
jgi:hypothetical protein